MRSFGCSRRMMTAGATRSASRLRQHIAAFNPAQQLRGILAGPWKQPVRQIVEDTQGMLDDGRIEPLDDKHQFRTPVGVVGPRLHMDGGMNQPLYAMDRDRPLLATDVQYALNPENPVAMPVEQHSQPDAERSPVEPFRDDQGKGCDGRSSGSMMMMPALALVMVGPVRAVRVHERIGLVRRDRGATEKMRRFRLLPQDRDGGGVDRRELPPQSGYGVVAAKIRLGDRDHVSRRQLARSEE